MNIFALSIMLLIGYLVKVGMVLLSEAHPNIPCSIPGILVYFKAKQLETFVDVLIIISLAGLWRNTEMFAAIKTVWIAPFISFGATKIWQNFAEKISKEKIS